MLTWKSVTQQLQTEDDKAYVCFITTTWKISSIGKAVIVDSERCPQHDGVNDATLVLSISGLSRIRASSPPLVSRGFTESNWSYVTASIVALFELEENFVLNPEEKHL